MPTRKKSDPFIPPIFTGVPNLMRHIGEDAYRELRRSDWVLERCDHCGKRIEFLSIKHPDRIGGKGVRRLFLCKPCTTKEKKVQAAVRREAAKYKRAMEARRGKQAE